MLAFASLYAVIAIVNPTRNRVKERPLNRRLLLSFAILYTVLATIFCLAVYGRYIAFPGTWGKMLPCLGFVLTALAAGALRSPYGRLLLIGLLFSWGGDYLLTKSGWDMFRAGALSFGLAHLFYIAAFMNYSRRPKALLRNGAAVFVLIAGIAISAWQHLPEEVWGTICAYSLVISVMLAASATPWKQPGGLLILSGAAAFYLSDLFLAYRLFGLWGNWAGAACLLFYFGGQTLLASSILRVNSALTKPAEAVV